MSDPVEAALFNGDEQLTGWMLCPFTFTITKLAIRNGSMILADDGFQNDDEGDLIGRVCDQIDRANPDLLIEECQAIARDIIRLVREYS